jgi:RimJ/RimL family protein N-acetyltransferase
VNDVHNRGVTITFRKLVESDLPMLGEWLTRPHVARWWDPCAPQDELLEKYLPRIGGASSATPYVACRDGQPIGYIQSYSPMHAGDGWWSDEQDPGVLGIDQFIADATLLNRGIGTEMVRAFTEMLFSDAAVTRIQADPAPSNAGAIRCYEKAGFRNTGEVMTPDGRAVLMVLDRSVG